MTFTVENGEQEDREELAKVEAWFTHKKRTNEVVHLPEVRVACKHRTRGHPKKTSGDAKSRAVSMARDWPADAETGDAAPTSACARE